MGLNKNTKVTLILLALFSLSILIRLPALDRPLSYHHEWLTAHSLVTMQIWHEDGIQSHLFLPIMSYNNPADKHISNDARIEDQNGNYYYTSYPPLTWVLPYLTLSALQISPDVLPLQAFNLGLHLINCAGIYLTIAYLTRKDYPGKINTAAVVAFSAYLFSMGTLWYHSNVYYAETLVQTFFIYGIYLATRYATSDLGKKYLLVFGIDVFLMTETEWLSGFFVASLLLYYLLDRKNKKIKKLFIAAAAASILALTLTLIQYSQINGLNDYVNIFTQRITKGSGITATDQAQTTLPETITVILTHYKNSYWPIILTTIIFAATTLIKQKTTINKKTIREYADKHKPEILTAYLALLPPILHHLTSLHFTYVHESAVLKTAPFITILLGLLYQQATNKKTKNTAYNLIIISALILSATLYINTNQHAYTQNQITKYKTLGTQIAQNTEKNEVAFIKKEDYILVPQITFYAHRNIAKYTNDEEAKKLITQNQATRGIIFELNDSGELKNKYYIEPA